MAKKAVAKKKGEQPAEAEYEPAHVIDIDIEDLKKKSPEVVNTEKAHLLWIYQRLVGVHNENPVLDYMVKLKEIIDGM